MTTKSIISIEVDDTQFQAFHKLFNDYQEKLLAMPDDWKNAGKATKAFEVDGGKAAKTLKDSAKASKDIALNLEKATKTQRNFTNGLRESSRLMNNMKGSSFSMLGALTKASLVIGAIVGAAKAVVGFSDMAVDRQRSARGLGMRQGEIKAFEVDMGRYVNQSTLGNIAGAQGDLTKRIFLSRATGMNMSDAATANPAELAVKMALREHDWWNKTAPGMRTEQGMFSQGFSQLGDRMEDVRRLGNTQRSEIEAGYADFKKHRNDFDVSDKVVSDAYKTSHLANIGMANVETIGMNASGGISAALSDAAPAVRAFGNAVATATRQFQGFPTGHGPVATGLITHNLGNIRNSNLQGFKTFPDDASGIRAMSNQIKRYENSGKFGHADTIDKIISTYAPRKDNNDTESYINQVSRASGYSRNQHIDVNDPNVMSRILSPMILRETGKSMSPQQIKVVVTNSTASKVSVSTNAASPR